MLHVVIVTVIVMVVVFVLVIVIVILVVMFIFIVIRIVIVTTICITILIINHVFEKHVLLVFFLSVVPLVVSLRSPHLKDSQGGTLMPRSASEVLGNVLRCFRSSKGCELGVLVYVFRSGLGKMSRGHLRASEAPPTKLHEAPRPFAHLPASPLGSFPK